MNEPHYNPIRKFNPGTFQSDEEVMRQFVVRNKELDIALEVVRGNIDSPSCQHILVVAPRGRGKTMLLARVAAELRTDEELSKRLFPVRFMEESQEIFTMADFWLETLFHLARETAAHDPGFAKDLQAMHAALAGRWHDSFLEQHARSAVLEATDRMGKKLVLMVENLQSLYESVDNDFGWKLREVLQCEPGIILLATATSRFKGLDDVNQPFFELFRSLYLEPLDTEACGRLWQVVSGDEKKGREIKPLKILTGGSPRLLVIIAEFAHHQSLRELLGNLVQMIDDHSEYFRGHLENIAPKERRVYLAVIDLWQMSSSNEIATRARMDIRTVSSLLGRLIARGAVIVEGSGKKRLYTATERLYSIYYKLRRERDEASLVQNLIQFMTVFYMEDELVEMSGRFISEADQSPIIRRGIEMAMAEIPQIGNVFSNMTQPGINRIFKKADAAIDEYDNWSNKVVAMEPSGQYQAMNEVSDELTDNSRKSDSNEIQLQIVRALVDKGVEQGKSGELEAAIATFNEVIERFGKSDELEIQLQSSRALVNKAVALGKLGQHKSVITACDEVIKLSGARDVPEIQLQFAMALANKGVALGLLNEHKRAIDTYNELVNQFGTSVAPDLQVLVADALVKKEMVLMQTGDYEAVLVVCNEMEDRFGSSDTPALQVQVSTALVRNGLARMRLDQYEVAIAVYDEVIQRFETSDVLEIQIQVSVALYNKGVAQEHLGQHEVAMVTWNELIQRFKDSDVPLYQEHFVKALFNKGTDQGHLGQYEAAIATWNELIKRFKGSDVLVHQEYVASALVKKGDVQGHLGQYEVAIDTCNEIVECYRASGAPEIQLQVARAIFNKVLVLGYSGQYVSAITACDEMVELYGESSVMKIQEMIVRALVNKGVSLVHLGEHEETKVARNMVGSSDATEIQEQGVKALANKGDMQIFLDYAEKSLQTCDEIERRIGTLTEHDNIEIKWRVGWMRMRALLVQGNNPAGLDTFRSMYDGFVPGDPKMINMMMECLFDLITAGVPEQDLINLLSSNPDKSNAFGPFLVALRQCAGEEVRAPSEVLEVAADIREKIEENARKETSKVT